MPTFTASSILFGLLSTIAVSAPAQTPTHSWVPSTCHIGPRGFNRAVTAIVLRLTIDHGSPRSILTARAGALPSEALSLQFYGVSGR